MSNKISAEQWSQLEQQKELVLNINKVIPGHTYYGTSNTLLTAEGYYLSPGDVPRRWNIKEEKSNKNVALLVCVDLPDKL